MKFWPTTTIPIDVQLIKERYWPSFDAKTRMLDSRILLTVPIGDVAIGDIVLDAGWYRIMERKVSVSANQSNPTYPVGVTIYAMDPWGDTYRAFWYLDEVANVANPDELQSLIQAHPIVEELSAFNGLQRT